MLVDGLIPWNDTVYSTLCFVPNCPLLFDSFNSYSKQQSVRHFIDKEMEVQRMSRTCSSFLETQVFMCFAVSTIPQFLNG